MSEFILNPALRVERIAHPDPAIAVYVVDDFLANPDLLVEYARTRAYFSRVGTDRTAYPGIRDRLPRPYERVLSEIVRVIYGVEELTVHRSMLSLTTLQPEQLGAGQRIPHTDAFGDDQFAAVHYLCGPPHGGTAIYRYLPRDTVKIDSRQRQMVEEMLQNVHDYPEDHPGYLVGDTRFYRQEVLVAAKFNRLVLYPSNLLHCAVLSSTSSLDADVVTGRLTVASFFQLQVERQSQDRHPAWPAESAAFPTANR